MGVHVVALVELAGTIERVTLALASALGTLAYEERLKLGTGLPAVVLMTPDAGRAAALVEALAAHGQPALTCALSDVVAASDMVSLKRFAFERDALVASDGGERLPWGEVAALVRATDRRRVESATVVAEKKFDLARTVITGGLVRSRTNKREVTTRAYEAEPVLYLFAGSGATPWLLREQGTHYEGLGDRLSSTAAPNFLATVAELRARAAQARYDERLVTRRSPVEARPAAGGKLTSPHDLDLLAYLVAQSLVRLGTTA
ncbi:MAG: hypothetical protein JWN44_2968 [Myxococcales bacterium]|nr:hypothetical protein [Myxococcales bacterium]